MENLLIPYQATTIIPCKKVLVFAPHPDDEVFGCGGAIMRHLAQGVAVEVIIVSDGAYGAKSEESSRQYVLQRQEESNLAAKILGYGLPSFWSYPDRKVGYGEKLIQDILAAINQSQADLIYAPSVFEVHPDHRSIGMAAIEAVRRIGKSLKLALYEVGMPMRPNCLLDISEFVERKMAAMQCFSSQNQKQRYDLDIAALNRYRTYTLPAEIQAAEAYLIISAEELVKDPLKLYQSEYARQRELGVAIDRGDIPLVSVIIRSMDRPTLTRALDSLALQTYPNIEVVLVNAKGGMHEQSSDWCGNFPLRLINQDGEPLLRSKAANIGLDACQGSYISFLDDDDAIDPDHIANLIEGIQSVSTCSIAYTGVRGKDEQDENKPFVEFKTAEVNFAKLLLGNVIPIHAILFPATLLKQGAGFDEKLALYEDWDFWLQLSRYTPFNFINRTSATYFTGGGSEVSPLHNDPVRVKQATVNLYQKWLKLLTASEFAAVADLHHRTNNQFQAEMGGLRSEISRLQDLQQQTRFQLEQKQQELDILYASRSWRLTLPLRCCLERVRALKSVFKRCYYTLPGAYRIYRFVREFSQQRRRQSSSQIDQSGGPWPIGPAGQILLIEHSVPRPDQDAGSMMIYNFIKVFIEMGYGVTFYPVDLAYDPVYTPRLIELKVRCLNKPQVNALEHHLAAIDRSYDFVLSCRPVYTEALIPIIKKYCTTAHFIYETHDLHFIRLQRQAEVEHNREMLAHSSFLKAMELNIAAEADCTIVVSHKEKEILLQENPNLYIEVIPVVSEVFGRKSDFTQRNDLVFIGNYEHRPNVDAVLYFVQDIFPHVLKKIPTIKFFIVGSNPPQEITALSSSNIVVLGFVPDITDLMNQIRISINPLRFGAGIKGKLITCMSYGIPCIGTGIAAEGMSLTHEKNILIADTPSAFSDCIINLYSNPILWEQLSNEGLAFVQQNFSLNVAKEGFTQIFNRLRLKNKTVK
ncbi:MAG TPA: glycosyltransferase [Nitrosomonas sp.]|nr:glycosyltransferase [Nitrosomonas sp.]